ncbi:hypothetical protein P7C73_g2444, partial [Tremellales sp. Uapishka_1]
MSSSAPLLSGTIEADDDAPHQFPKGNIGSGPSPSTRQPQQPVVLVPGTSGSGHGGHPEEGGIAGILKQSSHPMSLAFLYLFRSAAIAVYVLCGFFTTNYVLSIVLVVVLLSLDFWNTRNVAGRTLVGLRYWNEVDEEGESSWVFESRDPSRPANPIDAKMFWVSWGFFVHHGPEAHSYSPDRALRVPARMARASHRLHSEIQRLVRVSPAAHKGLLVDFIHYAGSFRSSSSPSYSTFRTFLDSRKSPLVIYIRLLSDVTCRYADRDAQTRWASSIAANGNLLGFGFGGIGGQLVGGIVRNGLGRMLG